MSDYHLDKVQQERVEKIVPLHQAKIHIAFKANLVANNKKYPNGAVALSEHMIVFCKQSLIGKIIHYLNRCIYSILSVFQLHQKTNARSEDPATPLKSNLVRFYASLVF